VSTKNVGKDRMVKQMKMKDQTPGINTILSTENPVIDSTCLVFRKLVRSSQQKLGLHLQQKLSWCRPFSAYTRSKLQVF